MFRVFRWICPFLALGLISATHVMAQGGPQSDEKYIVMFHPGTSQADRAAAVGRAGAALKFNYSIVDAVAVRVPNANALAALQKDPAVLSIIPDRTVHAIPDAINGKPTHGGGGASGEIIPEGVKRVGPPTAMSNGAGVGVAIVDTGIDLSNADLVPPAATFSAFGGSCQDDNGHGTHVSGIVAAINGNGIGTVGVAPAATLYCAKVLDSTGSGSDSDVMAGLEWAASISTIRVVNMSLGRDGTIGDNPALRAAVQALYTSRVTVVVAAGNDANKDVSQMVPASYPEVLAVASTTAISGTNACRRFAGVIAADTASFFTTDGTGVTISAPGEDKEDINQGCFISSTGILSTKLGGGTTRMSGTSMASPHVAGVVARILQSHPVWSAEDVRSELRTTAQGVGTVPFNSPTASYTFDGDREGIAKAP
jgi:subtilisin